jgi:hypothetical protein
MYLIGILYTPNVDKQILFLKHCMLIGISIFCILQDGKVCLWNLPSAEQRDIDMDDGSYDPAMREPSLLCEILHTGDVTDLEV